jgi:diaminohydroxyphosphoribosylaminopyrimidine deaminase / 5-amino-6-(5-phosphoribosylamino)uracil reductase
MNSEDWMQIAFAEALKVKGHTLPNPPVGAILVKRGKQIGAGGTQAVGGAHAEIMALQNAASHWRNSGGRSIKVAQGATAQDKWIRGSTLYVTLEPCCHFGRTPPCTEAIIAAGIGRVVISHRDPNPKVAGKGIALLRKAGIAVEENVMADFGAVFYRHFAFHILHGRPRIIVKIAQTLDGRINAAPGQTTAITGHQAQVVNHRLRTEADAWLIGAETLRRDNPRLTPRLVHGTTPEALILTRGKKKFPTDLKIFDGKRQGKVRILGPQSRLDLPVHIAFSQLPKATVTSSKALVKALLNDFVDHGYHLVVVEGGRSLWTAFLECDAVDELWLFTAAHFLPQGETWSSDLPRDWDKSLIFRSFTVLGDDTLTVFKRKSSP